MRKQPYLIELLCLDLLDAGFDGMNAEDAISSKNRLHTTCLNTRVSDLKRHYYLILARKTEILPRKNGGTKTYMRYWIKSLQDAVRVLEIIDYLREKRKAPLLTKSERHALLLNFSDFKKATQQ